MAARLDFIHGGLYTGFLKMKCLLIAILLTVGVILIAHPLTEASKSVRITKVEYDPFSKGMEVWIEGLSDRWKPVIMPKEYATELQFSVLVAERIKEYYDSQDIVPEEPTLPTDKINEAKKLIGKEIDILNYEQ